MQNAPVKADVDALTRGLRSVQVPIPQYSE